MVGAHRLDHAAVIAFLRQKAQAGIQHLVQRGRRIRRGDTRGHKPRAVHAAAAQQGRVGGDAVDPARLKVTKNQKINVTVKLNGFTFEKPAKMVLCLNFEKAADHEWENTCFDYSRAITVNSDGSYTVSWTNDTGETCNWAGTSALIVTMQYVGYASLADDSEEGYKKALTVESVTIE